MTVHFFRFVSECVFKHYTREMNKTSQKEINFLDGKKFNQIPSCLVLNRTKDKISEVLHHKTF